MRGSYAVYCAAKLLSVVYCILCIGPCYLCGIFFNYSRTGIVLGGMCLIVTLFVRDDDRLCLLTSLQETG